MPYGGEWVLVGSAVFKTVVGGEEPPGCVRFARASAICEGTGRPPGEEAAAPSHGSGHSYAMASATETRAARYVGSRLASNASTISQQGPPRSTSRRLGVVPT